MHLRGVHYKKDSVDLFPIKIFICAVFFICHMELIERDLKTKHSYTSYCIYSAFVLYCYWASLMSRDISGSVGFVCDRLVVLDAAMDRHRSYVANFPAD
jgi:hypothetical protein